MSAARILIKRGQLHLARILADIAGNDVLVASLLMFDANQGQIDSSFDPAVRSKSRDGDLKQLADSLIDINPLLHSVLLDYVNAKSVGDGKVAAENWRLLQTGNSLAPATTRITIKSLDGGRRSGLQVLSKPLSSSAWLTAAPVAGAVKSKPSAAVGLKSAATGVADWWSNSSMSSKWASSNDGGGLLQFVEGQQRSRQGERGGGIGPPSALGTLAFDSIEDLVGGRIFPGIFLSFLL